MGRVSRIQTALNAGEISPLLDARPDLQKYGAALRSSVGFLPLIQGAARRRGGFRYLGRTKDDGRAVFLEFVRSRKTGYVLEFGEQYIRFWTRRGQVVDEDGRAYEIASPYSLEHLIDDDGRPKITCTQSGDVLYLACAGLAPRKLSCCGPTDWTLKELVPKGGPWADANPDRAKTVSVTGARDGTVTLTANADIFLPGHAGSLFRLENDNWIDIPPWDSLVSWKKDYTYMFCRSDGKTYRGIEAHATGWWTGSVQPTHTDGRVWDGAGWRMVTANTAPVGVLWEYRDAGYGIVRITSVDSPTQARAVAEEGYPLPDALMDGTTWKWQFGAWSDAAGFPTCCAFFRERLTFGGGTRVWTSKAGDFENFEDKTFGEIATDNAVTVTVVTGQGVDSVAALASMSSLIVITGGGEVVVSEAAASEPFGPDNVRVSPQSAYGGLALRPARVGPSCLFVQAGGRKLRELAYDFSSDAWSSPDVTMLAEHITRPGILCLAYQQEPYSILWCARADGALIGLTHDRNQEVSAWHRHVVGGNGHVEALAAIPAHDRPDDELYAMIAVEAEGETRRFVCCLDEGLAPGGEVKDAFFLDCGKTVESSVPVTEIPSLEHLEGLTVHILADGAVRPPKTVENGRIALDRPARLVQVGLPYESRLETTFVEAGAQAGTAQGAKKRIVKAQLRVLESAGGEIGSPAAGRWQTIFARDTRDKMDSPAKLVSGDLSNTPWPGGWETGGSVGVRQGLPLPLCLLAIVMVVDTTDL